MLLLPGCLAGAAGACEASHVQCCHVLRDRGALDVLEGIVIEQVEKVAATGVEVRYDAIVHYRVAAKREGMIVDCSDRRGGCCADLSERSGREGVGKDGVEVEVIGRRLAGLLDGWTRSLLESRQTTARNILGRPPAHVLETRGNPHRDLAQLQEDLHVRQQTMIE